MKDVRKRWCLVGALLIGLSVTSYAQDSGFTISENKAEKRVDIAIDGKPFTSYIYSDSLMKPVLYPIQTTDGAFITRGWPLVPRAGERTDHPHHVGLWFNYGDVNGIDFWNNSSSIPNTEKDKYGVIRHLSINKMVANDNNAELDVSAYWQKSDGTKLLKEDAKYIFTETGGKRTIELHVKLTALETDISFTDNKEGLIGIRLARELEQASHNGTTGLYRSSEGKEGNDVWGTRGKWVNLNGTIGGQPVSIVILDHPENIGYPTYWHARDYGLFAANPLGQRIFSEGNEILDFKLRAGESVVFKYKVLINSGNNLSDDLVNREAKTFEKK